MLESKAIVHFAFYIIVTAGCPRCPLHREGQQGPPEDQPAVPGPLKNEKRLNMVCIM